MIETYMLTKNPDQFMVLRHLIGQHQEMLQHYRAHSGAKAAAMVGLEKIPRNSFKDVVHDGNRLRVMEQLIENIAKRGSKQAELTMIAAMTPSGVIGNDGSLPWKRHDYPKELAHFRSTTMGSVLIAGRKTAESIGGSLSGRLVFVVTHQDLDREIHPFQYDSYEQAAEVASELVRSVFIIGGRSAYEWGLTNAHKAVLSLMEGEHPGDVRWPHLGPFVAKDMNGEEVWVPLPLEWDFLDRDTQHEGFSVFYCRRSEPQPVRDVCPKCRRKIHQNLYPVYEGGCEAAHERLVPSLHSA